MRSRGSPNEGTKSKVTHKWAEVVLLFLEVLKPSKIKSCFSNQFLKPSKKIFLTRFPIPRGSLPATPDHSLWANRRGGGGGPGHPGALLGTPGACGGTYGGGTPPGDPPPWGGISVRTPDPRCVQIPWEPPPRELQPK